MSHLQYKLNYTRQPADGRDLFRAAYLATSPLPKSVDLSGLSGPILDQGEFGSCTAHSAAYVLVFNLMREKKFVFHPSRMFIYGNARTLDGTDLSEDSGTSLRSTFKAIAKYRVCDELKWPYTQESMVTVPPKIDYTAAATHKVFQYLAVRQTLNDLKSILVSGYPISFGITCYSSFMAQSTMDSGLVPMPEPSKEDMVGGHALTIFGYSEEDKTFLIKNSWGTSVGLPSKKGYFKFPYAYILSPDLSSDFWTCRAFY